MKTFKSLALICCFGCGLIHAEDTNSSVLTQKSRLGLELREKVKLVLNKKDVSQKDFNQALMLFKDSLALLPQKMDSSEDEREIFICFNVNTDTFRNLLMSLTRAYNLRTNENIISVIDLSELFARQLGAMKIAAMKMSDFALKVPEIAVSAEYLFSNNNVDSLNIMAGSYRHIFI